MARAEDFLAPDLDSTGVLAQAAADYKWPGGATGVTAKRAELWYDRFLELCYENPGSSPPLLTSEADQLWHTHITFTKAYRNWCMAILGYYLDHIPDNPRRLPTKGEVTRARKLYKKWTRRRTGGGGRKGGPVFAAITIGPDTITMCKP